jgi:outer membrane protein OmpA-like peptidoglycan-associated protein
MYPTKLLALWAAAVLTGTGPAHRPVLQAESGIRIQGICYNAGTGEDFKVKAFAVFGDGQLLLGESNDEGAFRFRVPDSTRYLRFERDGFQTATIPVHVNKDPGEPFSFRMSIPMSSVDSQSVKLGNQLYLGFDFPDSLDGTVKVVNIARPSTFAVFDTKYFKGMLSHDYRDVRTGNHMIIVSTKDGKELHREEVTVSAGFNFKKVTIKPPFAEVAPNSKPATASWKPGASETLYFEQSSYELTAEAKVLLQNIALYLRGQPGQKVHIMGYTDNVGKEDLNRTLSEYRVRRVANYLTLQGVPTGQYTMRWMGGDAPAAPNDTEENRAKNRRVVIEFLKE